MCIGLCYDNACVVMYWPDWSETDGAKQVAAVWGEEKSSEKQQRSSKATVGTITILLLCLSLFHIVTHRGIIAQRLGQPLIHLIQHSNKPQLHSNYYLAETAARTRSHLWCWCRHKRDNKAVVHSRWKYPWLLKGNRGYLLIFIWRVWRDIWVVFFYLNKQKSNKNAKNLGITVTTNTDKKQQNKEKKKTELFAWG